MSRKHRPSSRRDTRKPRIKEGTCSIANCSRPSSIIYYQYPLCSTCFDYYADLEDASALKRVLGIKEKASLEDFERDMFDTE